MNGYSTKVFEMQDKPGGVCVSWKCKCYTFDYAVHNVFGITPNSVNNHMWQELGALKSLNAHSFKEFVQVEDTIRQSPHGVQRTYDKLEHAFGRSLYLQTRNSSTNSSRLPETIRRNTTLFASDVRRCWSQAKDAYRLMRSLMKYSTISLKEYAEQFTDPFLRKAFATIQYDIPEVPVTVIALIFIWLP